MGGDIVKISTENEPLEKIMVSREEKRLGES